MNWKEHKHNCICDLVYDRLRNKKNSDGSRFYMSVGREIDFYNTKNTKVICRADVVGVHVGINKISYFLFEVKNGTGYASKARKQLKLEQAYINKKLDGVEHKVFKFYVHGYTNQHNTNHKYRRIK